MKRAPSPTTPFCNLGKNKKIMEISQKKNTLLENMHTKKVATVEAQGQTSALTRSGLVLATLAGASVIMGPQISAPINFHASSLFAIVSCFPN